jgi:hypothetical protein
MPFSRCRVGLQGIRTGTRKRLRSVRRLAFPPDLALTYRDSMASRDASLHPPVVEFIRVNRPAFDMLSAPPSPPWVPSLGFVRAVPPARKCHPRGFSPPRRFELTERPGFIAPQYRTGFAEFPTRATRIRRCWPTRAIPISAFHTLRRFSLIGSRTASLQPLPPRRSPSESAYRRPYDRRGSHPL